MIDAGLPASLAAFDDDALATLANPGLVRRARRDIEEGKVRLISGDGGAAVINADGQRVTLDRRGPKAAACTCRSVAICRHRIAAVMFARAQDGGDDRPADEVPADPTGLLAEIDLARLERWAGKAGWLAAFDLAPTAGQVDIAANTIAVAFPDVEGPVRILRGQGIEGIASKASKPRIKAYHAAAVLAARRHCKLTLPDPPDVEVAGARDVEVDPAFLLRVSDALSAVAGSGFNLAPLPLEETLFELSVSSRADSLPRLAAMLRAIAAQMRRRRTRALDFDPDSLLELSATARALVRALGRADPDRRILLAGKVRRDFAPSAPLELVGCGGEQWRSPSGARGVTAWFVEVDTGRWLSTTLARGAGQDPFFSPADAWRQQPLWQAAPLATLSHARLRIEGARESADGRLSAPAGTHATMVATGVVPDPAWPAVIRDWDQLRHRWRDEVGVGLDHADGAAAALIAPTRTAPPFFDDLAQQLVWPILDRSGQWLALTLDHDEAGTGAIEALEAHVRSDWRGLMLVRIRRAGDRLSVQPLTLFGDGGPIDLTLWVRPPRADHGKPSVRDWLARLRPGGDRRFAARPRSSTDAALAAAWRHLLDRAEIGPALAATLDPQLQDHAERLEGYGLAYLAALLRAARGGEGLLAAGYALSIARRQRCAVPLLR